MVGSIINVPKPLTKNQRDTLKDYRERVNGNGRPLTEKQLKTWHSLEHKENESNTYKLTDGQKKILTDLVFEKKYGRKTKLENKYLTKGIEVEKNARDLLSEVLNELLVQDKERKTNEWVTGLRDVKHDSVIIDIKSPFSYKTFNEKLIDGYNEIYLRQLDCYMDLWGIKESLLCYVLVDTPFRIIEDELRRYDYKNNIMGMDGIIRDEHIKDVKELITNHIYTREGIERFCLISDNVQISWFDDFVEIPKHERVHMIPHSYLNERIEQRNECITLAREYMNTVKPINNIVPLI